MVQLSHKLPAAPPDGLLFMPALNHGVLRFVALTGSVKTGSQPCRERTDDTQDR